MSRLTLPVSKERDHIQGSLDAPVTMVEYGDYECPHCGKAHPTVKALQRALADRLCFVYRHFPLTAVHLHAQNAAEAAEAAAAQGKFWEMHDLLFENQHALTEDNLAEYSGLLGLDVRRFVRELAEHAHAPRVREDFLTGVRSGVNGTPTFFINGMRHDGPHDADSLRAALEEAALESPTSRARPRQRRAPGVL